MRRQHWKWQWMRLYIYLGAGVLPALGWALLSLLLLFGGYAWLSVLAWGGLLGLLLASLKRPSESELRTNLLVTALLVLGLIAISPLVPKDLSSAIKVGWPTAAVAAPVVLAVYHIWQVLRVSSSSVRRILIAALVSVVTIALASWFTHRPPAQEVYEVARADEVRL